MLFAPGFPGLSIGRDSLDHEVLGELKVRTAFGARTSSLLCVNLNFFLWHVHWSRAEHLSVVYTARKSAKNQREIQIWGLGGLGCHFH